MMTETLSYAIFGLIGGMTRSLVGLMKAISMKKRIIWRYWLVTLIASCAIGFTLGTIFNYDYRICVLAGYAGTDLLENIYKSFKKEKIIFAVN